MRGVEDEVDEDLHEAHLVAEHESVARDFVLQAPAGAHVGARQLLDLAKEHTQVDRHDGVAVAAPDLSQITDDVADAVRAFDGVLGQHRQLLPLRVGERQPGELHLEQRQVADDVAQRVVDLVRHGRCEGAERRHALGPLELLLEGLAIGDVAQDPEMADLPLERQLPAEHLGLPLAPIGSTEDVRLRVIEGQAVQVDVEDQLDQRARGKVAKDLVRGVVADQHDRSARDEERIR